jgi:hypothetical protein
MATGRLRGVQRLSKPPCPDKVLIGSVGGLPADKISKTPNWRRESVPVCIPCVFHKKKPAFPLLENAGWKELNLAMLHLKRRYINRLRLSHGKLQD